VLLSRVVSVNVGAVAPAPVGASRVGVTAIDKRPQDGRVSVTALGLAGDEQADRRFHGGLDQAVYAYALEDLRGWAAEVDLDLWPGAFGENLTTLGIDVTGAVVGERWAVGTSLLEVSGVRIPCRVFQAFVGVPGWIKRFTERGACGAYLRVLRPGSVGKGDVVDVVDRPAHGVTVGTVFRALTTDPSRLPRVLDAPQLAPKFRDAAARRLAKTPTRVAG
jgi:MOSC domain-containing protein YiiM